MLRFVLLKSSFTSNTSHRCYNTRSAVVSLFKMKVYSVGGVPSVIILIVGIVACIIVCCALVYKYKNDTLVHRLLFYLIISGSYEALGAWERVEFCVYSL